MTQGGRLGVRTIRPGAALGKCDLHQGRSAFAGPGIALRADPEKQKAGAPPREPRPPDYLGLRVEPVLLNALNLAKPILTDLDSQYL